MKIVMSVFVLMGFAGLLWMNVSATSQHNNKSVSSSNISPDSTIHWDKMDHTERKAYMKQVVFPAMKAEFTAFDAKKFGKMECVTCHGEGAEDDGHGFD